MPDQESFAQIIASLTDQNTRSREQFARTEAVAEKLFELWHGEAAALLGAEWELADGRARALWDEELAILALLPAQGESSQSQAEGAPSRSAPNETWEVAELFALLQHAAAHFRAQEQELNAALAVRGELIDQAQSQVDQNDSGYAAEHRLWLKRAEDLVLRLAQLAEGTHAAREAYAKTNRMNTRMFRADLFTEHAPESPPAQSESAAREDTSMLYGQLSPFGFYTLADTVVAATERLLKALIAAELALEGLGPLARRRHKAWADTYDLRSQAVFLLAGDCLHAAGLLTRTVRQAGRNWEITEFNAGGGRGVLPEAVKVKEVVELRIAPPPPALAKAASEPDPGAAQKAAAIWRALADEIDALDKAVVAASGFDSEESEALESAIGQIAARLYAVQDGAAEIADMCADLHAKLQLPWWRRSSLSR